MEGESGNELPQSKTVAVEPGNRIQLPAEWCQALGLHGQVALDKTDEGILVRPLAACPPGSQSARWDEFFATKLSIGSAPQDDGENELEVIGDDLLF